MSTTNSQSLPGGVDWSLAMIVRDAEEQIGQVLDDVAQFCDEVVVVDTGSRDKTKEVAADHGARVFDFEWVDDFSAARNAAFEYCTGNWIMWLDADDRIPPEAQQRFCGLKEELASRPSEDVVMIPYRISFSDSDPDVCTFSFERERIVRRAAGLHWVGPVHEFIGVPGPAMRWPLAWIEHRPRSKDRGDKADRNLKILERAVAGGDRSSRTLFYLGNELRDHERWEEALAAYGEYLRQAETAVWERYSATISMAVCAAALGRDDEKVAHLYAAMDLDSTRAEAFMRIGLHHYDQKEWEQAVPYFAAASALRRPTDGFVDDMAYTWGPWDFLAVCHSELGMYQEAMAETVKALPMSEDRPRLLANMEFYANQLRARQLGPL